MPVKVSSVPSPNTAAPMIVKLLLPPAIVPFVVIVVPVKVVLASKVTLSLYVCVPEVVVMLPPLMAVVPDASVTKLVAAKVLLIVLVPVLFKITAPSAAAPAPTVPVKVTPPLPLLTVNADAKLLPTVDANETKLSVVVKVKTEVFAKVTAPV